MRVITEQEYFDERWHGLRKLGEVLDGRFGAIASEGVYRADLRGPFDGFANLLIAATAAGDSADLLRERILDAGTPAERSARANDLLRELRRLCEMIQTMAEYTAHLSQQVHEVSSALHNEFASDLAAFHDERRHS